MRLIDNENAVTEAAIAVALNDLRHRVLAQFNTLRDTTEYVELQLHQARRDSHSTVFTTDDEATILCLDEMVSCREVRTFTWNADACEFHPGDVCVEAKSKKEEKENKRQEERQKGKEGQEAS